MRKSIILYALSLFLIVTCATILYLYYAGGWIEPNAIIRIAELTSLYLLIGMSLVIAIATLFDLFSEKNELKDCPRCGKRMKLMAINEITEKTLWECKCGVKGWDGQL